MTFLVRRSWKLAIAVIVIHEICLGFAIASTAYDWPRAVDRCCWGSVFGILLLEFSIAFHRLN